MQRRTRNITLQKRPFELFGSRSVNKSLYQLSVIPAFVSRWQRYFANVRQMGIASKIATNTKAKLVETVSSGFAKFYSVIMKIVMSALRLSSTELSMKKRITLILKRVYFFNRRDRKLSLHLRLRSCNDLRIGAQIKNPIIMNIRGPHSRKKFDVSQPSSANITWPSKGSVSLKPPNNTLSIGSTSINSKLTNYMI